MKDERYWPVLGTWLKDTAAAPPDPQHMARKVTERIPETPQVRRRWWLPSLRRTPIPPHSNNQATPIPATNGHTPTVSGRTQSMFSPVKAITAGALVFAIGGAFLIAQPFDRQGGVVPGAEADTEPTAAWITGSVVFGTSCEGPTSANVEDVLQQRDFRCGTISPPQWQSDDPRFTGTGIVAHNSDAYTTDDGRYQVISSVFEVRNDAGGWQCTNADALLAGTSLFDASLQEFRMTCVGDGGYAGSTAILVHDFTDLDAPTHPFEGLVFPGEVPPFPETSPED
jgi:hypothetical protein